MILIINILSYRMQKYNVDVEPWETEDLDQ